MIRDHWDTRKTVKQNYDRLGLTSSLKGYTGAQLRINKGLTAKTQPEIASGAAIDDHPDYPLNPRVEIKPVFRAIGAIPNSIKDSVSGESDNKVISPYIESLTKKIEELEKGSKISRHASLMEALVLRKLIEKHGLNYVEMAKDVKINTYQLTPGVLKNKIRRLAVTN